MESLVRSFFDYWNFCFLLFSYLLLFNFFIFCQNTHKMHVSWVLIFCIISGYLEFQFEWEIMKIAYASYFPWQMALIGASILLSCIYRVEKKF